MIPVRFGFGEVPSHLQSLELGEPSSPSELTIHTTRPYSWIKNHEVVREMLATTVVSTAATVAAAARAVLTPTTGAKCLLRLLRLLLRGGTPPPL